MFLLRYQIQQLCKRDRLYFRQYRAWHTQV